MKDIISFLPNIFDKKRRISASKLLLTKAVLKTQSNIFQLLAIFAKRYIIDVRLGSKYACKSNYVLKSMKKSGNLLQSFLKHGFKFSSF